MSTRLQDLSAEEIAYIHSSNKRGIAISNIAASLRKMNAKGSYNRALIEKVLKTNRSNVQKEDLFGPTSAGLHKTLPTRAPESTVKAVLELKEHTCKWPIGDPYREGFGFCKAKRLLGRPYCEQHTYRSIRKEE